MPPQYSAPIKIDPNSGRNHNQINHNKNNKKRSSFSGRDKSYDDSDDASYGRTSSTITVMEIGA